MTISKQDLDSIVVIDCTTDPLNKQGGKGIVIEVDEVKEEAKILFECGIVGRYNLDCFQDIEDETL